MACERTSFSGPYAPICFVACICVHLQIGPAALIVNGGRLEGVVERRIHFLGQYNRVIPRRADATARVRTLLRIVTACEPIDGKRLEALPPQMLGLVAHIGEWRELFGVLVTIIELVGKVVGGMRGGDEADAHVQACLSRSATWRVDERTQRIVCVCCVGALGEQCIVRPQPRVASPRRPRTLGILKVQTCCHEDHDPVLVMEGIICRSPRHLALREKLTCACSLHTLAMCYVRSHLGPGPGTPLYQLALR